MCDMHVSMMSHKHRDCVRHVLQRPIKFLISIVQLRSVLFSRWIPHPLFWVRHGENPILLFAILCWVRLMSDEIRRSLVSGLLEVSSPRECGEECGLLSRTTAGNHLDRKFFLSTKYPTRSKRRKLSKMFWSELVFSHSQFLSHIVSLIHLILLISLSLLSESILRVSRKGEPAKFSEGGILKVP